MYAPFLTWNMEHLHQLSYQQQVEREEGGSQWGKMGKNGERILWGKHFRIGNFPHFSPFKKKLRKKNFGKRKSAQGWGKMGKNGERILWGKHFTIGNFPHFSPLAPPTVTSAVQEHQKSTGSLGWTVVERR